MPNLPSDVPIVSTLAALPLEGWHFSTFKIILFTLCFILWAYSAAWTDKDTVVVRTRRGPWTLAVFGTGALSLAVWLLVPIFWIGLGIFAVVYGTGALFYVVFRNGRVSPAQTVLTMAHLRRLTQPKPETAETIHAKDRVRLKDSRGKLAAWPKEPELRAGFEAMQELLFDVIWRRASDVRLDLTQQDLKIVYKVDGVERSREPIEPALGSMIFNQIKTVGGMNPQELRRPQHGHFVAAIGAGAKKGDKVVDVDVKSSGSTAGQRIVMKMFAEENKFRLTDIGFTKEQLEVFEPLLKSSKGIVLVSGPKESGVTSTLYAIVRGHDAFMQNIHTLEIQKALDLENVTQNVWDQKNTSVSYGKRFQSMLRTDPDIAMASDVPDAETAKVAANNAKLGKKIYMGMTADDTFGALRRFAKDVGDVGLVSAGLVAITNQRLVRVLCLNCRRGYKPDPALLRKANLPLGENRPFYRPPNANEMEVDKQGNPILCPVCQGSGYHGRTGVFEILLVNDKLRALIAAGKSLSTIREEARKGGMLYMQEIALRKVYDGLTSINEVLRVTKEAAGPSGGTPGGPPVAVA